MPFISRLAAACACLSLGACASNNAHAPAAPAIDVAGADAAYAAGRQHFDAGRLPAAQAAYEQALRSFPSHVHARNGLAVLHAQRGEHAAAIAHWRALTQDAGAPQQAYLLSNLGRAYVLSGNYAQALPVLEKACLLDPLNPLAWQHLAQVLEQLGEHARAGLMLRQAQNLQAHDARRDYALLRANDAAPATGAVADEHAMARIEITQGDGMARLRRVPAARSAAAASAVASAPVAMPAAAGPVPRPRLEILNGNGVPGMAASMARSLAGAPVRVVRLANQAPFQVPRTRVEYRPAQQDAARLLARQLGTQVETVAADCPASELRLILGRDLSDPVVLHRYYLQQLQLARKALARLG
ncbi:MAG: tetratricopeptide repeat protein [Janthinobacterium sp.]|jgi:Tfp pilus assembly protein PilF